MSNTSIAHSRLIQRHWLLIIRAIWVILCLVILVMVTSAVWGTYRYYGDPERCTKGSTQEQADCLANERALHQLGLPIEYYGIHSVVGIVVESLPMILVGILVFSRKWHELYGLIFSLSVVVSGTITFDTAIPYFYKQVWSNYSALVALGDFMHFLGNVLVIVWYCFPDGRFVPRWTRWLAMMWVGIQFFSFLFPNSPFNIVTGPEPLPTVVNYLFALSVAYSLIYRYQRVSDSIQRQQIKWVVASGMFFVLILLIDPRPFMTPGLSGVLRNLIWTPFAYLSGALIAVSIAFSILRYRLWDIDFIVNRALVYSALTASVVGLYVLIVGGLGALLQTQNNLIGTVVATLLIILLIQPLRRRLQNLADRFVSVPPDRVGESIATRAPQAEREQNIDVAEQLPHPMLSHSKLIMLRMIWVMVALSVIIFIAVAVPNRYAQLTTISPNADTLVGQLQPAEAHAFEQAGIPVPIFAAYITTLGAFIAIVFALIGLAVAWLQPQDRMALLASIVLIGAAFVATAVGMFQPQWRLIVIAVRAIFGASVVPFFFLFPDGRFVPRWTRWLTGVWLIYTVTWLIFPSLSPPFSFGRGLTGSELPRNAWFLFWGSIGLAAQIYRYLKFSNAIQQQQIKVVVFGFGIGLVALVTGISILTLTRLTPLNSLTIIARLSGISILLLGTLAGPLSIGISILRYHLFDIDVIINRTLVYGALIVSIIGLYMIVVGAAGVLFQSVGNTLLSILATGLIAVLFHPLRQRLQRGINRLMYGDRDDPYAALSRLGRRLESTLAPEAVLPTVVNTVREVLKLPYVAIYLGQDHAGHKIVAESASSSLRSENGRIIVPGMEQEGLCMPLIHQGETLGYIVLGPRAPNEAFNSTDLRLLEDLAPQVGVAVHAVRLTADLQRSRERLVLAREEERRRLRRDLHDGLGPQLAGLTLKLEAARNRLANDPLADSLLADLAKRTQNATADIRHLVYDLRPPTLDELGLVSALREGASQYSQQGRNGVQITIDAPENLPPLPAAVEVAVYRITQEALTNVVRHAEAHTCKVRLALDEQMSFLCLEIQDDGRGLSSTRRAGVGLNSMRERAEELGGSWTIESIPTGGTRLLVRLPYRLPDAPTSTTLEEM